MPKKSKKAPQNKEEVDENYSANIPVLHKWAFTCKKILTLEKELSALRATKKRLELEHPFLGQVKGMAKQKQKVFRPSEEGPQVGKSEERVVSPPRKKPAQEKSASPAQQRLDQRMKEARTAEQERLTRPIKPQGWVEKDVFEK